MRMMDPWASIAWCLFVLLLCLHLVSSRYASRECDSKDDLGYFSIRDCFYIENIEASVVLTSSQFNKDHMLGAVMAIDTSANKKIFNASSLLWYLSPTTGQLFNLQDEMVRMEPFSQGSHPRYICLRPKNAENEDRSSWVVEEDPVAVPTNSRLILKHEASGRLLTFNGVNRSVSLEPRREAIGKGGISAIVHDHEPFRIRHASSFYQKSIEGMPTLLRSPITDQRWDFVPFSASLFMIVTQTKNNHYLAVSDVQHSNSNVTRRVDAVPLDIDDPRQVWFVELTLPMGQVVRNLATGRILDAAINSNEENSGLPFNLPVPDTTFVSEDDEDEDENPYKGYSVYLVSSPLPSTCRNSAEYPLWNFDNYLKRSSIHLPGLVKRQTEQKAPSIVFSNGRIIQKRTREQRMAEALSFLAPDCKEAHTSFIFHQDKTNFAISFQEDDDALTLEQINNGYLCDENVGPTTVPARQHWIRLPLNQADDPATLFSLIDENTKPQE